MKNSNDNNGKYSKEVEEILTRRPSFIVRNGILLLVIIVAIFLFISAFIRYPERLTASISFSEYRKADSTLDIGLIILTADAASLTDTGQPVTMNIAKSGDTYRTITVKGLITSKEPIGSGDYFRVCVTPYSYGVFAGYEGTASIVTGESTLLSRILNPVISAFRPGDQ